MMLDYLITCFCHGLQTCQTTVYTKTTRRMWRNFDLDTFVSRFENSELCCMSEQYSDPDMMLVCYDTVIIRLIDELIPMTDVMIRERNRQLVFDNECRTARRKTRWLERKFKSHRNEDLHKFVLLLLLDHSVAFDTVDHDILLHRLLSSFGVGGDVLLWFKSYLIGRSQSIFLPIGSSVKRAVSCEVPQGSILGASFYSHYLQQTSVDS